MKRLLNVFVAFLFLLIFTGCGKPDETWNGVYKNDSDYSILIYTPDQKTASIAALQKNENVVFYAIEYANRLKVSDNELTMIAGEPVKVVKDGLKIKITLDAEQKGAWKNIEGEYTKVKNAKSFNRNQF